MKNSIADQMDQIVWSAKGCFGTSIRKSTYHSGIFKTYMKTQENDPSRKLDQLSRAWATESVHTKKIDMMLEYLEIYIEEGGTIKTWAKRHFEELRGLMEDPGYRIHLRTKSRFQKVKQELTKILESEDLDSRSSQSGQSNQDTGKTQNNQVSQSGIEKKKTEKIDNQDRATLKRVSSYSSTVAASFNYLMVKVDFLRPGDEKTAGQAFVELWPYLVKAGLLAGWVEVAGKSFGWDRQNHSCSKPDAFGRLQPLESSASEDFGLYQCGPVTSDGVEKIDQSIAVEVSRDTLNCRGSIWFLVKKTSLEDASFQKSLIALAEKVLAKYTG